MVLNLYSLDFDMFIEFWYNIADNNVVLMVHICIFLPILESFIPFLPLVVIVAYNMKTLCLIFDPIVGNVIAIGLSALGSFIGTSMIFIIIRFSISKLIRKKIENNQQVLKATKWIENRSNYFILLLMANPYVPTSILNYAFAITNIKIKRYLLIIFLSRICCVLLLALLGIIFNIQTNPYAIVWICLTYFIIYVIIYVVKKIKQ